MTVKIGICGLGFAGSILMAPDLADHPDIEIVAACDPNEPLRTAFGADYGIAVFPDLTAMIAGAPLDAVYIASPHQFHRANVVEAAAAGLHAIVEKPLTISLEDAQAMVDAVEQAGVHLIVGHSRGNDPVVRAMAEQVRQGDLGRVAMINILYYNDFLYRPRRPEELDTSKGGGIVFNQLPHAVDSIKAITGQDIVSVKAHCAVLDPARPTEGLCAAFLTLSGGAVATLTYSGYDHFDSDELQFWVGETGNPRGPAHGAARRVLREYGASRGGPAAVPGEPELRAERYGYGGPLAKALREGRAERKQSHFGLMIVKCEHGDMRPSPDGLLVYDDHGMRELAIDSGRGDNLLSAHTIDDLVSAVREDKPIQRNARWGMNTVAVCLAVLESTRRGEEVRLDELALAHA